MPKITLLILTLFISLLLSSYSIAGPIQIERDSISNNLDKIDQLKSINITIEENNHQLSNQRDVLNTQRPPLYSAFSDQQRTLKKLQQRHVDTPNNVSEGIVKNAAFKFYLAERKYNKLNENIIQLDNQLKELTATKNSNKQQITTLQAGNSRSNQRIVKLQAEQQSVRLARQQQQKNAKIEHQQAAAAAQIKALKGKLLAAENRARVTIPPLPSTAAATPTPASQQLALFDTDELLEATEEVSPVLILDRASAKKTVNDVDNRVANSDNRNKKINKILHIKTYHNKNLIKQSSHTMKHLGNDQYRAKARVRPGMNKLVVGNNHWTIEIPKGERRQWYDFILDFRNNDKPILVTYNRNLIN